jgi:hypothetical protein
MQLMQSAGAEESTPAKIEVLANTMLDEQQLKPCRVI